MSPDDSSCVTHWLQDLPRRRARRRSATMGGAPSPVSSGWPRPDSRTNRRPGAAEDEEDAAV